MDITDREDQTERDEPSPLDVYATTAQVILAFITMTSIYFTGALLVIRSIENGPEPAIRVILSIAIAMLGSIATWFAVRSIVERQ